MLNNIKNSNSELIKVYGAKKKIKRRYLDEKKEGKVREENKFNHQEDTAFLRKTRN